MRKVIVIPDMHVPYHDEDVWELILLAIQRTKPTHVVIIGDFADFYTVSSHSKDPARKINFQTEVDAVNEELDRLQAITDRIGAKVVYVEGNHENRLDRFLAGQAPQLASYITTRRLFEISRRGWKWVPYRDFTKIGKMHFTHDLDRSGKHAAAQAVADFGGNVTIGHTHRGCVAYLGTVRGENYMCLNVGWGGDFGSIDYKHKARALRDWQHGFGLVYVEGNGNCHAQFVPIVNGTCVVDGKHL